MPFISGIKGYNTKNSYIYFAHIAGQVLLVPYLASKLPASSSRFSPR